MYWRIRAMELTWEHTQ
ncbi:hypothetical protein LINPERHAP1_LOCUS27658 [Linum perenne]